MLHFIFVSLCDILFTNQHNVQYPIKMHWITFLRLLAQNVYQQNASFDMISFLHIVHDLLLQSILTSPSFALPLFSLLCPSHLSPTSPATGVMSTGCVLTFQSGPGCSPSSNSTTPQAWCGERV